MSITVEELVQGIQFTVDHTGQVTAVVLRPDLWHRIAVALENTQDSELAQALRAKLGVGLSASDALRWQNISEERALRTSSSSNWRL
jgi:hypothetical protein